MATTVQIQDTADAVLDAYKEQIAREMPGVTLNKGITSTEAIIRDIFPKLSPDRQKKLVKTYPQLTKTITVSP